MTSLSEMVFSHLSAWYSQLSGKSLIQQSLAHNRSYILDRGLMGKLGLWKLWPLLRHQNLLTMPIHCYNAYSFTKHKKVYWTTHSKTSLTQSIKKSTKNVQQSSSGPSPLCEIQSQMIDKNESDTTSACSIYLQRVA